MLLLGNDSTICCHIYVTFHQLMHWQLEQCKVVALYISFLKIMSLQSYFDFFPLFVTGRKLNLSNENKDIFHFAIIVLPRNWFIRLKCTGKQSATASHPRVSLCWAPRDMQGQEHVHSHGCWSVLALMRCELAVHLRGVNCTAVTCGMF